MKYDKAFNMESQKVINQLREMIVWLKILPESVLNVSEIAKNFGVSRTPVKEALIFLQAEGWLLRKGSHFIVTPISIIRIRENAELRSVLEIQTNLWAMNRITDEEFLTLKNIERKICEIQNSATNEVMVALDLEFHRTLYQAAKNSQAEILMDLFLQRNLRVFLSMKNEIDPQNLFREVKEMIHAIEVKDEIKLREATLSHINKTLDLITKFISMN